MHNSFQEILLHEGLCISSGAADEVIEGDELFDGEGADYEQLITAMEADGDLDAPAADDSGSEPEFDGEPDESALEGNAVAQQSSGYSSSSEGGATSSAFLCAAYAARPCSLTVASCRLCQRGRGPLYARGH